MRFLQKTTQANSNHFSRKPDQRQQQKAKRTPAYIAGISTFTFPSCFNIGRIF